MKNLSADSLSPSETALLFSTITDGSLRLTPSDDWLMTMEGPGLTGGGWGLVRRGLTVLEGDCACARRCTTAVKGFPAL